MREATLPDKRGISACRELESARNAPFLAAGSPEPFCAQSFQAAGSPEPFAAHHFRLPAVRNALAATQLAPPPADADPRAPRASTPGEDDMPDDTHTVAMPRQFQRAYAELLPEMQALAPEALLCVNLDVHVVVTTVLGAWPKLVSMRPQIAAGLPGFDLARFDRIERLARALMHAHTRRRIAAVPPATSRALAVEIDELRCLLRGDAEALARRGLLDAARLANNERTRGRRARAVELLELVELLHDALPALDGKTAITRADLQRAEELATQQLAALGTRAELADGKRATSDLQRRAFTLLVRAYEDARRALLFLYGAAECNRIAPSLYAGRRGRAQRDSTAKAPDDTEGERINQRGTRTQSEEV
jgi:hypothetical protein